MDWVSNWTGIQAIIVGQLLLGLWGRWKSLLSEPPASSILFDGLFLCIDSPPLTYWPVRHYRVLWPQFSNCSLICGQHALPVVANYVVCMKGGQWAFVFPPTNVQSILSSDHSSRGCKTFSNINREFVAHSHNTYRGGSIKLAQKYLQIPGTATCRPINWGPYQLAWWWSWCDRPFCLLETRRFFPVLQSTTTIPSSGCDCSSGGSSSRGFV